MTLTVGRGHSILSIVHCHRHVHCTSHFHKHEHCVQRLHHADGRRWQEEEMAVKEQVTWQEEEKWPLKTVTWQQNESTLDNKCDEEFSLRIVVICLVVKRSLENACMAFCTWNKTLKGNTPVYYSCASSIDSRLVLLSADFYFLVQGNMSVFKQ